MPHAPAWSLPLLLNSRPACKQGFEKDKNPKMFALAAYYLFLLGMVLFTLGCFILSVAIGIPPALGVAACIAGPISVLIWMPLMKMSITGIPGIMGPPMPARIVLIVIGTVTTINAIMHGVEGDTDGATWTKFFSIFVSAVGIPHLISFKHRSEGWDML